MEEFTIRNWREFQHYSDRNPPWIKLHFALLSSEDWVMLADASRVLMIASMLVASRNSGRIPNNPEYFKRLCHLKNVDFKPLIDIGFLECDSNRKQMLADARPEERREETEKRQKNPAFVPPSYEEVETYCKERNSPIDPIAFHSHYATNGWRVGKAGLPMKSWQAAIVTWERRMK